jgi:DNA-binding NarL/FixJ family response regulator
MMVKLMLVDDFPVYRQGVAELLNKKYSDFVSTRALIVGEMGSDTDILKNVKELRPDIVLLDFQILHKDALGITEAIRKNHPDVKVIILSLPGPEEDFFRSIQAGASAYMLKNSTFQTLAESIHTVATGNTAVSAPMLTKLIEEFRKNTRSYEKPPCSLSQREIEILNLAARGQSNKGIAAACYISETTVKAHFRNILSKMDVRNRAGAVAIATAKGFVKREMLLQEAGI